MKRATTISWAILGSVVLLTACGGSKPPADHPSTDVECPPGQTFDGQFCQVTGEPPVEEPTAPRPAVDEPLVEPAADAATDEATPGPDEPVAETATPTPTEPGLATPVDISMAASAAPLIQYMAGAHLPSGAQPFGTPFAAQFAEGQSFEQQVQLQKGRCYTVVAAGLPPIAEVNLEVKADGAAGDAEPVAEDSTTGPQAVLGSRDACFVATGDNLVLVMTVQKGNGVAAGQVFQK